MRYDRLQRSAKDQHPGDQERVPDAAIRAADRTNPKSRSGLNPEKKKQEVSVEKNRFKALWTILVKEENEKPKNVRFTKSDKSGRRIRLQRSFAHQHPTDQGGAEFRQKQHQHLINQIRLPK